VNIGINALFINPGRVGGAEQMARALVEGICTAILPEDSVLLLTTPEAAPAFQHLASPQMRIIGHSTFPNRALVEPLVLARLSRSVDVWLNTNYFTPPLSRVPQATVIHDSQFRHFPANFSRGKRAWISYAHWSTSRRAARVIAISEEVARDFQAHNAHAKADRICVIPNPIDWRRLQVPDTEPDRDEATVLTVAANYPHKNLPTLIEAMHILRQSYPRAQLVLLGQSSEHLVASKTSGIPAQLPDYVRRLGYVSDETLAHWLGKATVFAAPSLFEGFGMTVVEAAVAGLPVAATPLKVYDETCAGATTPVRAPLDSACWAATLAEMLADPKPRCLSQDARLKLRHRFSVSTVGNAYYQLLRSLVSPVQVFTPSELGGSGEVPVPKG
jgi:glycosyltransferase involved in cell wall biosynthesis